MCVFPPSLRVLTLEPRAQAPALFRDSYLADVTPWLFLLKNILLIETALRNCLLDHPYTTAFRIPISHSLCSQSWWGGRPEATHHMSSTLQPLGLPTSSASWKHTATSGLAYLLCFPEVASGCLCLGVVEVEHIIIEEVALKNCRELYQIACTYTLMELRYTRTCTACLGWCLHRTSA